MIVDDLEALGVLAAGLLPRDKTELGVLLTPTGRGAHQSVQSSIELNQWAEILKDYRHSLEHLTSQQMNAWWATKFPGVPKVAAYQRLRRMRQQVRATGFLPVTDGP